MAQLVSSKNLFQSSHPLVVGVVASVGALDEFVGQSAEDRACDCDVVELRLDMLGLTVGELRERLVGLETPCLMTARHPAEGGAGPVAAEGRMALLEPLLDLALAVDVELQSLGEMRGLVRRAQTLGVGVVGSFHDFQRTPSDEILEGAASLAESAGVDVVKVATTLNTEEDLIRLLRFVARERRIKVSAMGMGSLGRVSRLVLGRCGSLLNYGFLGSEANAAGQWPADQLKSLLKVL